MDGAADLAPPLTPARARGTRPAPLIAHVIFHFGVGGLENGIVNLINHMPADRYRHAIVCLKGFTDFRHRITRKDVEIVALNKREGNDLSMHLRLYRTLRRLRPDIVHTRNLAAMEGQLAALLAGVPHRVHGEHGRDMSDLDGSNARYRLLRRALRPLVHRFTAVSRDLEHWLARDIGVPAARVTQIYNGVDSERFRPRSGRRRIGPEGFAGDDSIVIGSVGRMAAVKDFPRLAEAFVQLLTRVPDGRRRLRLAIVGEGESRAACQAILRDAGAADLAWLPGERADIGKLMPAFDVFALPSLGEGISNTILEAMSCGLPVVATKVGGNIELVRDGATGRLVVPGDARALADALAPYCTDPALRRRHGGAARAVVEARHSMASMTDAYLGVYDSLLGIDRA